MKYALFLTPMRKEFDVDVRIQDERRKTQAAGVYGFYYSTYVYSKAKWRISKFSLEIHPRKYLLFDKLSWNFQRIKPLMAVLSILNKPLMTEG